MTAIAERAAAGAAFLDEHDPGWWEHDGYRCILGQRCPLELPDGGPSRYYLHAGALSGIHVPPDRPLLAEHEIHAWRSEEHTSELQSRGHLVCRLLLEKKK